MTGSEEMERDEYVAATGEKNLNQIAIFLKTRAYHICVFVQELGSTRGSQPKNVAEKEKF